MSLLDFIGSALSIVFIILIIRRQRLGWLFGGVGSGIYVFVLFQSGLYFQSVLFSYYVVMAVYGFVSWAKNSDTSRKVIVSRWRSFRINLIVFVGLVVLGFFLSMVLSRYTPTTMGFADATITTVAFFATYLQTRSKIENWYYWVFVNSLSVVVSFLAGLYFFCLLSLLLLGMSFYGIWRWQKIVVHSGAK